MGQGAMYPNFWQSLGGYKDAEGTREYMNINKCYELSLHVNNELR